MSETTAYVLLDDGARFDGIACGADAEAAVGEIVFTTSMSGYQEAMTDPSYAGQLITFTYPQVGNYGVYAEAMESDRVHAGAAIMRDGVDREDAPVAEQGWLSWLRDCGVPAITDVDTRALVRHIRDQGAMKGGVFAATRARGQGSRADRRRAADERPRPGPRGDPCRDHPARASERTPRSPHRDDRHRRQALDRSQPPHARSDGRAAPVRRLARAADAQRA